MQAYRLSLSIATGAEGALRAQRAEFDRSMRLLRDGDPERPLVVPWDDTVREKFATVERDWAAFQQRWRPAIFVTYSGATAVFTEHIDALVGAIDHMSRGTALLHILQVSMMVLAVLTARTAARAIGL